MPGCAANACTPGTVAVPEPAVTATVAAPGAVSQGVWKVTCCKALELEEIQ